MAIHITDPETDATVRRLAQQKDLSLTEAIRQACAKESAAIDAERTKRRERVREILAEIDSWPKSSLPVDKAFFDSLNGED